MTCCCFWFSLPAMETTRNENGSRPARIRRDYHANAFRLCRRHESNYWIVRDKEFQIGRPVRVASQTVSYVNLVVPGRGTASVVPSVMPPKMRALVLYHFQKSGNGTAEPAAPSLGRM